MRVTKGRRRVRVEDVESWACDCTPGMLVGRLLNVPPSASPLHAQSCTSQTEVVRRAILVRPLAVRDVGAAP